MIEIVQKGREVLCWLRGCQVVYLIIENLYIGTETRRLSMKNGEEAAAMGVP